MDDAPGDSQQLTNCPLDDQCRAHIEEVHKSLFGNGEPEHSVIFRLTIVETTLKKMSRVLWAVAAGVGTIVLRLLYDWISGINA